MQHVRPLQDHPHFSLIHSQGWHEYRVRTPRRGRFAGIWTDAGVSLAVAYFWKKFTVSRYGIVALILAALLYLYARLTRILWESVVILPSLGIQLETHRGVAGTSTSLLASRKFIPWSALEDFLINEGIRGWDIRYYLVAICRTSQGTLKLEVAYENLLPRFPILLEVYHGVQDALHAENAHRLRESTTL